MKIVVIGAGGMLGSMVACVVASRSDLDVVATLRDPASAQSAPVDAAGIQWRALDVEVATSAELTELLRGVSWVINAVGVIKPYIRDTDAASVQRALLVNSLFPQVLATVAEECGCRVLQIATDCVYSGTSGGYCEDAPHDALDVYGKTKSLGEVRSPSVHHLRCSIVGPEMKAHVSLLDWFRSQPLNAVLKGFVNHDWNGVTTLHFSRLCLGMIQRGSELPHLQHIVPSGTVTKKELLDLFAREYGRSDLTINPVEADVVSDRTLATSDAVANKRLWQHAGYTQPPTVAEMIAEMAAIQEPLKMIR